MLPVTSNQSLIYEQILGLPGNIHTWKHIQLRPDVLSTEFTRSQKCFPFDRFMSNLYKKLEA